MRRTFDEWKEVFAQYSDARLEQIIDALRVLHGVDEIREEINTRLFDLGLAVRHARDEKVLDYAKAHK